MKLIFAALALTITTSALADTHVRGYTRSDGTYVQPHTRNSPDSNRYNNNGSQTNGGSKRDEYSSNGATNKSNSSYGSFDNDKDGVSNNYDKMPESSKGY